MVLCACLWAGVASCSGSQSVGETACPEPGPGSAPAEPEGTNEPEAGAGERAEATAGGEVDPCDWEQGGQMGLPRCPNTGDPIPDRPVTNPDCRDVAPDATRWLAMSPHTPLAITDGEQGIVTAGQPCCAPWARRGARYRSLNAYGQVSGIVEITGGAGYDVTRCFELGLGVVSGADAALIYASVDGGWQPPASAEWRPDADARRELAQFVELLSQVALIEPQLQRRYENEDPLPPLGDRTLFFQVTTQRADGRGTISFHYAVSGGRLLLIAWYSPEGKWVLAHLVNDMANVDSIPIFTYRPIAVVDMDGDGVPEVVYHWNEGPAWGQVVLRRRTSRGAWEEVAHSVGGSTA